MREPMLPRQLKDAHNKALAAAAYMPVDKAEEFVNKLGMSAP